MLPEEQQVIDVAEMWVRATTLADRLLAEAQLLSAVENLFAARREQHYKTEEEFRKNKQRNTKKS